MSPGVSSISDVEDWLNGGVILPSEEMKQEGQNLETQQCAPDLWGCLWDAQMEVPSGH